MIKCLKKYIWLSPLFSDSLSGFYINGGHSPSAEVYLPTILATLKSSLL